MKRLLLSTTLLVWAGAAQAQTASAIPPTITPGSGSITDAQGHVWQITASGSITQDGQYVPGGGGTAALTIGADGKVLGKDNGYGPINAGGWFILDSNGQTWSVTQPPADSSGPTANTPSYLTPIISQGVCGNGTPTGSFHAANGHLLGPDGKDWIARGINVADNDIGAADQMIAMFPGMNFIRLAIYKYQDPSVYSSFVTTMTDRGTVVEFEHHVETNGATGGGGQGDIASGAWLAQENAFYASIATAFKNNPYVWFGTTNEPPGGSGGSLSRWQKSTYDAIRGTGNTNPILLEIMGWPGEWNNAMDPSIYASMQNVVWDTHYYGWVPRYSTDQATVDQDLADLTRQVQQITGAEGTIPALAAEFGPSTTGQSPDANGSQTVDTVINSAGTLNAGNAAWHWGMQDCCNNLNSGSSLTDFGQKIAMYIGSTVQPCTEAQTAANAATNLTEITQQALGTDPASAPSTDTPPPPTPAPDTSIQAQIDAADAAIAQATAALAVLRQTQSMP